MNPEEPNAHSVVAAIQDAVKDAVAVDGMNELCLLLEVLVVCLCACLINK